MPRFGRSNKVTLDTEIQGSTYRKQLETVLPVLNKPRFSLREWTWLNVIELSPPSFDHWIERISSWNRRYRQCLPAASATTPTNSHSPVTRMSCGANSARVWCDFKKLVGHLEMRKTGCNKNCCKSPPHSCANFGGVPTRRASWQQTPTILSPPTGRGSGRRAF